MHFWDASLARAWAGYRATPGRLRETKKYWREQVMRSIDHLRAEHRRAGDDGYRLASWDAFRL